MKAIYSTSTLRVNYHEVPTPDAMGQPGPDWLLAGTNVIDTGECVLFYWTWFKPS